MSFLLIVNSFGGYSVSIQSAASGFGVVSKQEDIVFSIPYVCRRVYIGQTKEELLNLINEECTRDCDIQYEGSNLCFYDNSGVYLKVLMSGVYVTGIVYKGIGVQIPEGYLYVYGKNKYVSSIIVDGHMLWVKSANEVKLKPVKGVVGKEVSSKSLGVEVRKVTKRGVKNISDVSVAISSKPKNNINGGLYLKPDTLKSLADEERQLKSKISKLNRELKNCIEKLTCNKQRVVSVGSSLEKELALYNSLLESQSSAVRRYGEYSANCLIENGYLDKKKNGVLSFVCDARKPDTTERVVETYMVELTGAHPVTSDWYEKNNVKYHKEKRRRVKHVQVVDPMWVQAKKFKEFEKELMDEVERQYELVKDLEKELKSAKDADTLFSSKEAPRVSLRVDSIKCEIREFERKLEDVRKSLYK